MGFRDVFSTLNAMLEAGVIGRCAVGGAIGATFHLEPVATDDVDVFVTLPQGEESSLLSLSPIYEFLKSRGCEIDGEHIIIGDWPVQFLPAADPLTEEALAEAAPTNVEGEQAWVFSAEHLAAIALQVGRAKDMARMVQFVEAGALDLDRLDAVLARHCLVDAWQRFKTRYLDDEV